MSSTLRPKGTVEVPCSGLHCAVPPGEGAWFFWVDALDARLPNGPFLCGTCERLDMHQQRTGRSIRKVEAIAPPEHEMAGATLFHFVFADTSERVPDEVWR